MTKDEVIKHRDFIIDLSQGKPLQVWSAKDLCWYDSPNPSFRLNCIYRVKPTPTPEEESASVFKKTFGEDAELRPYAYRIWEAARKYYQANKG